MIRFDQCRKHPEETYVGVSPVPGVSGDAVRRVVVGLGFAKARWGLIREDVRIRGARFQGMSGGRADNSSMLRGGLELPLSNYSSIGNSVS